MNEAKLPKIEFPNISMAPKPGEILLVRFEADDGGQREAYVRYGSEGEFRLLRGDKVDSRLRVCLWRLADEIEKTAFEQLESTPPLPLR